MAGRIVLISDDTDFFEYIRQKLELRKSDELFMFSFDNVPEKLPLMETSVLIVNSENSEDKTLDLLKLLRGTPAIVFAYNEDDVFRRKCYRLGMFDFMTILTPDAEFRARIIPALTIASILEKNQQYREILVNDNYITPNNEVFLNYNYILDKELEDINSGKKNAVFAAIAPNDKTKFLLTANMIETVILANIRRNDILMSYAPNKYFLLMYDTNISSAQSLWEKVSSQLPQKLYAGFVNVSNQKRQQLINEVLNKLHESINNDRNIPTSTPINGLESYTNFKLFRQEFGKKFEQIITPVFYQIQQKYSDKFAGISIQQEASEGFGVFYIKGKNASSSFRITSPGFSKINIDITYQRNSSNIDAKRITLEPDEFEAGLLEDLLEQFILEYKRGLDYDNSQSG
ncbi:MAG: hypothetical protein NC408_05375 [Candidatus Gastranaerophilales bacterium]|nr:hypothetical protein [Candidatus Gastranaerophilales bacterium]MCM1072879.1 hypothetical protein [Bacteroides sp.]